jgi:putative tryptophan/tyrosine transport system substrate-binding protein
MLAIDPIARQRGAATRRSDPIPLAQRYGDQEITLGHNVRRRMQKRTAAVLLVSAVLLISLGFARESRGQANTQRVGILGTPLRDSAYDAYYAAFRNRLAQHGWIEGKNVAFEYRDALGQPPQFDESAAQLVGLKVDVIYANSAPATRAAYVATQSIPIVALDFTNDPVAAGYADSYGRPGRNLTGIFLDAPGFAGKWLELLKAVIPRLSRIAVLWDPSPGSGHLEALQVAARSLGVKLEVVEARTPDDFDKALASLRGRPQALIILPSPMIWKESARLAALAMKHRLPATSMADLFAKAGGAISYGPDVNASWERAGVLVAQILGGAKPAELPVESPAKFQLIVNLKTAKALGLTIPESILLRADEVIR